LKSTKSSNFITTIKSETSSELLKIRPKKTGVSNVKPFMISCKEKYSYSSHIEVPFEQVEAITVISHSQLEIHAFVHVYLRSGATSEVSRMDVGDDVYSEQ
jgi:hypothetical protein